MHAIANILNRLNRSVEAATRPAASEKPRVILGIYVEYFFYMTIFLSWFFVFFLEKLYKLKGQSVHFLIKSSTTPLYKACENTDVWYSVFHCGGKVSAVASSVSPMRLV